VTSAADDTERPQLHASGDVLHRANEQANQSNSRPRRFKRYPAYQNSSVDWLGNNPAHWEVSLVYARYEVALGKMLDAKRFTGEFLGRYLRNIDVQWDNINTEDLPEMDFAPWERERYLLYPGDLLVCEGGEVGRTAIWRGEINECYYQKAIHRVRPRSNADSPRFFYYLMYALAKRGVFVAGGNPNTIGHLTAVQLRHYRLPFAPPKEQPVITKFLDRETAKTDALVAKKERLIELLQEKRAALITRAVTKGLDPNVPMKDSGVEWLGEIPAHREVKRNGLLFRERDEREFPELPLLDVSISTGVNIRQFSTEHIEQKANDPTVYKRAKGDDISFNKMRMWQGAVGVAPVDGLVSPDYTVAVPLNGVNPRYFVALFRTSCYMTEIHRYSHGIVPDRNRLYWDAFKNIKSIYPPFSERKVIVEYLDTEGTKIDALIAKIREGIEKLKEYRTALISAAVTGKIDVREDVVA